MSDDLMEQAASVITRLADRLEARIEEVATLHARIEAMEQQNAICIQTMEEAAVIIEKLKAALRQIVALDQKIVPPEDRLGIARSLARVALAPEQDK